MDLSFLSDVQKQAVTETEGRILVLAGAGSGKTSVLTSRVAYLLNEKNADPYSILAITFTNKAAAEMKGRIAGLVDFDVSRMAISTFHSMCARFLRSDADKLGYTNSFSIYDTDDSLSVIKRIMQETDMQSQRFPPRYFLHMISAMKNSSGGKAEVHAAEELEGELAEAVLKMYAAYQERLKKENAMDFDDLLVNMLKVLNEVEEARRYYTNRFKYVMVDEYQDTNSIQYELIKIFSEKHGNLFVVGDDDQSIYGWRGADVRNIFNFEKDYQNVKVIKLEQNYRSHQKILDVANAVIKGADFRKDKTLWSARKEGPLPKINMTRGEYEEAEFIAGKIAEMVREGRRYEDMVVLYRTHTQARVLEEKLRAYGIPYRVFGGMSFYARKEIKDMVAYLMFLNNPRSDTAFVRIVNTPKRGIGNVSIQKLADYAAEKGISMFEAAERSEEFMPGSTQKFSAFLDTAHNMLGACHDKGVGQLAEEVFFLSGYREMLLLEDDLSAETKIENVQEFITSAYTYEKETEEPTLEGFLSTVSLITDMDTEAEQGGVTLMTLHAAKGLEFDTVFMAGMEENLFPSKKSLEEGRLDEERRLCYVGITRAKNELYMTGCLVRNLYSGVSNNTPSRFLEDIPKAMAEDITERRTKARQAEKPRDEAAQLLFRPRIELKSNALQDPGAFRAGMKVEHAKFGAGTILNIAGQGDQKVATVKFSDAERKLFLGFAPLKIVE